MTQADHLVSETSALKVERVDVRAYKIPTDGPDGKESDGTLTWDSTTLVLVEARSAGEVGIGYTYADVAAATLVESKLKRVVEGRDPFSIRAAWHSQLSELRNLGQRGVATLAVSALDIALWDLKAKLLGLPLFKLLTPFRGVVPIYGSGGFCNYALKDLAAQVRRWLELGISSVKIKTSRHPEQDPERLSACRGEMGAGPSLMTDANGALNRKQALYWACRFREEWNVAWMEEPVSSDDREGLRLVRDQGPPGLEIAAGEYGFVLRDFVDLLQAQAVDCVQADVTRCGGITGLLQVAGLCAAHGLDLSAHCAPAISAHAFCAVQRLRHLEYFHDHVRIERLLFDGTLSPEDGALKPDQTRAGLGLVLKHRDAERYLVAHDRG